MKSALAAALALITVLAAASPAGSAPEKPWWRTATIYEIYPRSFADSNGDGVGDLNGVTQHLPYLHWLGVRAIWLAPVYPSPQVDFGYDISNYEAIDPQYGTLADFDRLEHTATQQRIGVIMDLVLNHTSDKHPWFVESASSRTNPKADWYCWSDGLPAGTPGLGVVQKGEVHDGRVPPNNWTSLFGGSAWQWVPARHQFYYHRFYRQQPDLNWRNPAVEKAMFGVMRFWLDRGVAGFRLDAISSLFEDPELRNEPQTGGTDAFGEPNLDHRYTDNLPELHAVMRRMRKLVESYPGHRVLIGETYMPDIQALAAWYGGPAGPELNLAMDTMVGFGRGAHYSPDYFRPKLKDAETGLDGQPPLVVFDNHDNPRSIDRFGDGVHDVAIAKGVAAILLASRDVALTYDGAEIGMHTRTPDRREDVRDPIGVAGWPKQKGRDGERTPMQWTPGPQAGFSTNPRTWLPVNPDHDQINVETERADPASLLNWYQQLIGLRSAAPALRDGDMTLIDEQDPNVLAWVRRAPDGTRVVVAINMTGQAHGLDLPGAAAGALATSEGATASGRTAKLPPFAVWIGSLAK